MHLVTTVTLLCVALTARADGSAVQSPAIDASDSLCRSLDTACANLWISIQCKVTKSCVPRWELTDSSAVGNDTELCALCKKMVKQARHQLLTNETQSEIRQVVDGSCDIFLPVTPLNTLCKKLMNLFVDELNDVLVSRMNPTQVCSICGLCWASTKKAGLFDRVSYVTLSKEHEEAKCNACKNTIRRAVSFAELIPQDKVVDGFMKICEVESGNRKQQCEQFAQIYVDKLFEAVKKDTPERSCQALEQCPGDMLPTSNFVNLRPYGDVQCEFCEAMLHQLIVQFNNTTTKLQVKAVLEGICRDIGSLAKECLDQVTKNFDVAYDGLLNFLNSPVVCRLLGLCSASAKFEVTATTDSLPMARLTSAISRQNNNRKPIKISLNDVVSRDQDPSLNSVCTTCELVVSWVATMLNATTTENDIIALINEVCDSSWFPDNQRNECRNMVAAYGSLIMHLLVNAMDPHKVCTEIKFCTELTQNRVMRTAEKPAEIGHEICEMCQLVARYLVRALNNDDAKDNIEAVLQQICLLVPADPAKCQEFVDEHIEALYKKLRKDVTVDHICKGLHVCDQPRQTTFAKTRNCVRVAGQGCILCAGISEWVLAKIRSMKSKTEILAGYERLCSILPGKDRAECQNVVDTYGEIIYNLIRQNVTSEQVCKSLLCCVARQPQDKHCELCKLAATWIIDEVKNNKTEVTIVQALTEACSAISNNRTKSAKCVIMSSRTLVHLIQQDLPASEICSTLDICESRSTAAKRQLTDDNDCDVCEVVADWLVKQSLINTTEAFIIKALEQVCKVVPVDKKACQNIVDTYSFLIFQLLREKVTPVQICYVIGLCNQPRQTLTVAPKQLVFKPSCMHCDIILNRLINEIAINKLEICHELLPQRLQCQNFIDAYRDMIFQLLKQDTTYSETCWLVGLCEEARPPVRIDHSLYTSVITMVLAQIENNKTEQAILAAMKNVCSSFSTDSAGQCRYFISTYGDQLLKHIGQDLDLQEAHKTITPRLTSSLMGRPLDNSQKCSMCQIMVNIIEFGLRNNNSQHEIEIFLNKVCSALSTDEQATCRTMIDVYTSYIIQMIENLISSKEICQALTFCPRQAINIKCEICIFILNLVEDQLGNNQTESEILEVLDKSCDLLSPQNVSECRFIVKQFVDMTITLLVQNAPPRKICEEVRQCPKALQPVKNIASISAAPLQRPDEKCSFCKWLITWVDDKLKENHTEAIIKEELDKACDLLNDSTECKEMANSYVDMIVKMLVQYVDPEHICETLGKCPKKAVLSSRVEPPCQLCKYYVHELRDRLNSSNAEAEIKSGLDQICAALSVDGKECTDLVDRYTHLLIRVILENTDLEVVCRTLKVCPTKITIRPTATNCDYCQKIVNFISMEVKNEDNDEKIIEVIEKVCDYVPIQYQEDCHRMVEIDGMVIFRMIAESVDPDIICAAIKLCSTNGPDLVCTLCEYSLHYIQEKLYDNATQAEIRSELDKMCAKLKNPGMASDCKEFIDVYGSALET
ncbi:uncharacterized protein LOC111251967 isoform X3 [Varroa destructor]|uniref:Saposin B-type domain-containing protein n=1 Tax=Varroa destructor TaxID=109461 RepID=A0A7M7KE75_VARDE|nr:uncharacterized protein LOC111251967 isoform X3 [Varroa destructor]